MRKQFSQRRGSVLLITLVFVILLAAMAIAVLDLSLASYRLTMRNQLQAEARAVAESELEYLLFEFKNTVLSGNSAANAPAFLAANNTITGAPICDNAAVPDATTTRAPFLAAHQAAGWRVRRSMILDRFLTNQRVPGTTKIGDFTYVIARVEVLPPTSNPFASSTASVRVGRRFINSNTTIFQYSVFFQGNLELNPGTNTTITGDIVANGSIYMGPMSGYTLTLNGKVRYLADHYFNTAADGTATYSNPDAPTPPVTLVAPTFATSQASQLETLDTPENLLGGIDVTVEAKNRPDLFGPPGRTDPSVWSTAEWAQAENNVYRSLVVPPPKNAGPNEYPNGSTSSPDDAVISVRRAYSRAGLILTVNTDGTILVDEVSDGVATRVTSTFSSAITKTGSVYTANVYDQREAKNIAITEIDVSKLKTTLDTLRVATDSTKFDFNGLLYVNLTNTSSTAPAAVRLINATNIPLSPTDPANPATARGLSVATNGGIYVQGSFNTGNVTDTDGTVRHPPAMLIGDAITVLSSSWSDANAASPLTNRVAGLSAAEIAAGGAQINAGLLTGNIAATTTSSSGGAQNLVRYLEDWRNKSINYLGSIGRLFSSTQFLAPYTGPGSIYWQPTNRVFTFDTNMLSHRPPGSPESTAFSRGSFFTWQYP